MSKRSKTNIEEKKRSRKEKPNKTALLEVKLSDGEKEDNEKEKVD